MECARSLQGPRARLGVQRAGISIAPARAPRLRLVVDQFRVPLECCPPNRRGESRHRELPRLRRVLPQAWEDISGRLFATVTAPRFQPPNWFAGQLAECASLKNSESSFLSRCSSSACLHASNRRDAARRWLRVLRLEQAPQSLGEPFAPVRPGRCSRQHANNLAAKRASKVCPHPNRKSCSCHAERRQKC